MLWMSQSLEDIFGLSGHSCGIGEQMGYGRFDLAFELQGIEAVTLFQERRAAGFREFGGGAQA